MPQAIVAPQHGVVELDTQLVTVVQPHGTTGQGMQRDIGEEQPLGITGLDMQWETVARLRGIMGQDMPQVIEGPPHGTMAQGLRPVDREERHPGVTDRVPIMGRMEDLAVGIGDGSWE